MQHKNESLSRKPLAKGVSKTYILKIIFTCRQTNSCENDMCEYQSKTDLRKLTKMKVKLSVI